MINYDPDGRPEVDPKAIEQADQFRMHVFQVVCDEPSDDSGEPTGVSFLTIGPFLPRAGEIITLEDGKDCVVKRVYHKVGKIGGKTPVLFPNVYAVRI